MELLSLELSYSANLESAYTNCYVNMDNVVLIKEVSMGLAKSLIIIQGEPDPLYSQLEASVIADIIVCGVNYDN